ncbi:MAG TPA: acyltransferase [Ktedonobacterales bacterium]
MSKSQIASAPTSASNNAPPAAAPAPESRAQLRRLLRGDLRQLGPLLRKAREASAARRQLRHVTSLGRQVRVRGRVFVQNDGQIHIGERVHFVATTVPTELVAFKGGELTIGPRTFVNYGCSFAATARVAIGADCLFGPYVNITDNDFHDLRDRTRQPEAQPVTIGDHVWIGTRALILPGVTIGDGAVVGAGSVVTKDIPPNGVVAGNPARLLRILDDTLDSESPAPTPGT